MSREGLTLVMYLFQEYSYVSHITQAASIQSSELGGPKVVSMRCPTSWGFRGKNMKDHRTRSKNLLPDVELQQYYHNIIALMAEIKSQNKKFSVLRQMAEGFPLKCRLLFHLLLAQMPQGRDLPVPTDFKKAYALFAQAFSGLIQEEQLSFLGEVLDHLAAYIRGQTSSALLGPQIIETSCEVKQSKMGIPFWQRRNFKFNYQLHRLEVNSSKKEEVLDLRNYLVRASHSDKGALVMECIEKGIPDKLSKVTVRFKNSSILQEVLPNVRRAVVDLASKRFEELLKEELKQQSLGHKKGAQLGQRGFTILTSKKMTDFFETKEKLSRRVQEERLSAVLLSNREGTQILRSKDHKKFYYLEQNIFAPSSVSFLKESIPILSNRSIPNKLVFQALETFSQSVTANYYKFDLGLKEQEFLVVSERIEKGHCLQQTMKAATKFYLDISVQFILVTLKRIADGHFLFRMSLILTSHKKNKPKLQPEILRLLLAMAAPPSLLFHRPTRKHPMVPDFGTASMVQIESRELSGPICLNQSVSIRRFDDLEDHLSDCSDKRESSSEQFPESHDESVDSERFYSITGDEDVEYQVPGTEEKVVCKQVSSDERTEPTMSTDLTYLKAKAFNSARAPSVVRIMPVHFREGEWRRSEKGGIVCINEAVISEQKRLAKLIISRIGSNIFKGNSVMNISLPVQAFSQESLLVSLAKDMAYAPLLLESSVKRSPLARMQQAVLFEISINALAPTTRKPFNPILGETYQGELAGCPIFLEQVSHHPPVSSVLMSGRGFRLSGTMGVQVGLRLNSIKAVGRSLLRVDYEDGTGISFGVPSMVINGIIMGERSIYWEDTVYAVDEKNLLICEIVYNVNNAKKSVLSFKSDALDRLQASIYQVSPEFMASFQQQSKKPCLQKEPNNRLVSKIEGDWDGQVLIDGNLAFDFEHDLPVELEHSFAPLPSDSTLRTDILQLIKGDMNSAQDEKERLEELQRNDRKLRKRQAIANQ